MTIKTLTRIVRNTQPKGKPWLIVQGRIIVAYKFKREYTVSQHDSKEDAELALSKGLK